MRFAALEEHFTIPSLIRRIDPQVIANRGFPPGFGAVLEKQLADIGVQRIADMDEAGITMRVLSLAGPGADLVEGNDGIALAHDINDALANAVAAHPDRLAGVAHLPTASPPAAADELERAVRDHGFCGSLINGLTDNCFLDHLRFEPILHRRSSLTCRSMFTRTFRRHQSAKPNTKGCLGTQASRSRSPAGAGTRKSPFTFCVLDRHPRLRLIIGHMGDAAIKSLPEMSFI